MKKISSESELREIVGFPGKLAENKEIRFLDLHCREFISKSPFLVLSSSNNEGLCDASPRGDAPGFVSVLDDHTLLIPERPGNRRLDTLLNILSNPHVGLIFLIPGMGETLRINGKAFIIKDQELLAPQAVNGKTPLMGIMVKVEQCFIHCAKAILRSQLWKHENWLDDEQIPSGAKILAEHANLVDMDEREVSSSLKESYEKRLY
ncbi:PPOX class probable FMN-dependent enzyme [Peribacillus deserti]|uniref:PPOX class probable FMN-dependent enzyme n=1 Tax=Peribacillus deserti TaxID=673318 RepID=A0ABS2QDT8_9BACI|nr:pyridoxamine 5'-phosphate oxidase family protein [Peribacillus deserti]MBM7691336.1 PPOX class probable FMN-dependent enzyme [Peribacillus deserti]